MAKNIRNNLSSRGAEPFHGNRTEVTDPADISIPTQGISDNGTNVEFVPIRQTPAYKQAFELFSKLDDKKWLMRLESIADSVPYYEASNGLNDLFNHDKYLNKNKEAVSLGVQQINALIAEYQEFQNSLPSTQAQQFADANLNPLTQNYSGSDINPQVSPTSVGVPEITPTSEIISSLVSLATSASGGLMSFISSGVSMFQSFQDLKIKERQNLIDLASKGIVPSSKEVTFSNREFLEKRLFPSAFAQGSSNRQHFENLMSEIEGSLTSDLFGRFFNSSDVSDAFKDLSELNYEIFMNDYRKRNSQLKRETSENVLKNEVFNQVDPNLESERMNMSNISSIEASKTSSVKYKSERSIENTFNQILQKWIKQAQSGSFVHQYLIMNLRTSGNTGVSEAISTGFNLMDTLKPIK